MREERAAVAPAPGGCSAREGKESTHARVGLELHGGVLSSCTLREVSISVLFTAPTPAHDPADSLPFRDTSVPFLVWMVSCSGTTALTVPPGCPPP